MSICTWEMLCYLHICCFCVALILCGGQLLRILCGGDPATDNLPSVLHGLFKPFRNLFKPPFTNFCRVLSSLVTHKSQGSTRVISADIIKFCSILQNSVLILRSYFALTIWSVSLFIETVGFPSSIFGVHPSLIINQSLNPPVRLMNHLLILFWCAISSELGPCLQQLSVDEIQNGHLVNVQ